MPQPLRTDEYTRIMFRVWVGTLPVLKAIAKSLGFKFPANMLDAIARLSPEKQQQLIIFLRGLFADD